MKTMYWPDRGFIYLLLGSTLFSLKGILIKLAYQHGAETTVLIALRMIFSLPVYLFFLALEYRKIPPNTLSPSLLLQMAVIGIFGYYFASWLDLKGLQYIPANIGRLILYVYPGFVILISFFVLRKPLDKQVLLLLLVIYAGLVLVLLPPLLHEEGHILHSKFLTGCLITLGSGFCYAIYLVGSDGFMQKVSSRFFVSFAISAASFAIFIHFVCTYPIQKLFEQNLYVYGYALAIAIFSTILPSFFIASGIKRLGAETGSAVTTVSPVITLIFAFFILGETLDVWQIAGFVIVIGAVFYLGRLKKTD